MSASTLAWALPHEPSNRATSMMANAVLRRAEGTIGVEPHVSSRAPKSVVPLQRPSGVRDVRVAPAAVRVIV